MHIKFFRSLRFKLLIGVVITLIPLVLLLIFNNENAISVVHSQVALSDKNMMTFYMSQIDSDLNEIDGYIYKVAALNNDFQILEYTDNENDYQLSKLRLFDTMKNDIKQYDVLNSIFVYSQEQSDFFYAANTSVYEQNSTVSSYIVNLIISRQLNDNGDYPNNWLIKQIANKYYLVRIINYGDTYIGAWIDTDRLLIPLDLIDLQKDGVAALVDNDGTLLSASSPINTEMIDLKKGFDSYYLTGSETKYLVVGASSGKGQFHLAALIPNATILQNLPYIQYISTIMVIITILFIPIALFLIQRIVIAPLRHVISTMKTIRNGNVEERIETHAGSEEFALLNQTFNSMLDEIQDLKISVYEEKITSQQAEFEQLQLQVNPHFFLNSLNMLYLMVETKNYDLTKDMLLCLLGYFRYMLRDKRAFVYLKEELDHVQNYLHIQELRYPNKLFYITNIPEYFLSIPVPPLIIQGFVENCIKHAYSSSQPLTISINVSLEDEKSEPYMQNIQIQITDTGTGFPEQILMKLQNGEKIVDNNGEHVGIWNTKKRLAHLYHNKAILQFSNANECGAVVTIRLPTKPE